MSDYVSNIETTDGIKKIKDSEARDMLVGINNAPVPVLHYNQMTDHNKLYIYTGSESGQQYGYVYYYDSAQERFVPGWQYQTFQLGTFGQNPCYISLPSVGIIMEGDSCYFKMTVYALGRRRAIEGTIHRPQSGEPIEYLWINEAGEWVMTTSITPPDSGYSLVFYISQYQAIPATPCNIVIDGVTWNQAPVKELNWLWTSELSEGITIEKSDGDYVYTIDLTVYAFSTRININHTVTLDNSGIWYFYVDSGGNVTTTKKLKNTAGTALLMYGTGYDIAPCSPVDVNKIYEGGSHKTKSTTVMAGITSYAEVNPVTGVDASRNYVDFNTGELHISYLRIMTTGGNTVVLQNVDFSFTVNSGYHIIVFDTVTGNLTETNVAVSSLERYIWVCTCIPIMNYFKTQFSSIRLISNQASGSYFSLNQRIGLFGDSIMTGTVMTNISRNLCMVYGVEGYNGAVGGSGFLKGWADFDDTLPGSTHSTGQFNLEAGVDVTYAAGESFDIGTMIDKYLQNMLDLKISHVYIHNGNNDILSGSVSIAAFWDGFNPPEGSSLWYDNALANRVLQIVYKLKSYNIDTTIMLPIGRQYVSNGVYSNNNTYNTRREKYIKIMEALQDRYGIELLRTDRLYSAIVPKTSGLQISPQESSVPKFLSSDNLHPTAWGYGKMAATIYNHYCNFNKGQQDNFH